MQIPDVITLIRRGPLYESGEWDAIEREIQLAIAKVVHPPGACDFALKPVPHGNGVTTIKRACIDALVGAGWRPEERLKIGNGMGAGKIDVVRNTSVGRPFALEWETGNISSSHRSVNKMALGILQGSLAGGAVILPSGRMYPWITDRVGNLPELQPYFPLWEHVVGGDGVLAVFVIEQDRLDDSVPLLAKMTDGMHALGKARRK